MISRRVFIQQTALAAAGLTSLPLMHCHSKQSIKTFGFITGIVKKELQQDWQNTLIKAVELGFTEVEGTVSGVSAKEYLAFCQNIGLTPIAGHLGMSEDMDQVKAGLEKLQTLNMRYAVNYWPWFVGKPFTLNDCKKSVPLLNKIGRLVKEAGLSYCWHNHDGEFAPLEDGRRPIDFLMSNTDPELVHLELDVYWAQKGGADPVTVMQQFAGRIPILHIKDMAPGDAQDFACPGSGIMDFPAIFKEAAKQDIQHFFVERDNVPDGMACLESSSAYLKNLHF